MEKIKHQFKLSNGGVLNHFKRHKQNYLFGMLGGFAIVKTFLFLFSFFGVINISGTFAQELEGVELNSSNILDYCPDTWDLGCDLTDRGIISIAPGTFDEYTNLQYLLLRINQLTEINLSGLNNLEILDLGANKLTEVNLTGLNNLKILDLRWNQLTEIDLSGLTGLQHLDLGANQLTEIDLSGLTGLQELDLDYNQLTEIDLSGLSSLETLSLGDNQLTEVELSGLSNLESLYLGHNRLTEVDLSWLTGLEYLDLSRNQLTTVNLSGLTGLQSLYLNSNQLTEVDLSGLSSLETLSLGDNQLTEVDLSGLSGLEYLYLSSNQLTGVDLSGLTGLQELDLRGNQLTGIDFSGLTGLQNLNLHSNQLIEIDLSGLSNLKIFYLHNNQLTEIIGLTELGGIYYGSIGNNHLPKRWIQANSGFFQTYNITYGYQTLSGCTNPTAYNYNPDARNEDDSCLNFNNLWTVVGGTISKAYGSELGTGEIKDVIFISDDQGIQYTGSFDIIINGGLPNTMVSDDYRLSITVVFPDASTRNVIINVIVLKNADNCCINGGLPGANRDCIDYSPSDYDRTCKSSRNHRSADNCGVDQSSYTEELKLAYIHAYEHGITTMCPIQAANLDGYLYRNHFAKMISEYAMNVLGKTPNLGKVGCDRFEDINNGPDELYYFIKTACELGLMGLESDGQTPMRKFYPNGVVTRAEFGTILSRLLYGDRYNTRQGDQFWYSKHLQALKNAGIMTKIDGERPQSLERRGRAMLMFMR